MTEQITDLAERSASAQHLRGQPMAKLMRSQGGGIDAAALQAMPHDRPDDAARAMNISPHALPSSLRCDCPSSRPGYASTLCAKNGTAIRVCLPKAEMRIPAKRLRVLRSTASPSPSSPPIARPRLKLP